MRGNAKKDMENPLQHPDVSRSNICSLAVHVLDILEQLYADAFVLKIVLLSRGERGQGGQQLTLRQGFFVVQPGLFR